MSGAFAAFQPRYAAIGLPTFPIAIDQKRKQPLVRGYGRMGLPASRELVMKGRDGEGIACMAGARNNLTVIDIDARGAEGERLLADVQCEYGPSRFIVRTGSGGFHAYYLHNGEVRRIRPDPSRPVDLLGGGVVVLPPSRGAARHYEIIEGTIDDLSLLVPIKTRLIAPPAAPRKRETVGIGRRNDVLFRTCMREAHYCDDLDALLDVARTSNADNMQLPLNDAEVLTIASSAWGYTERGENRVGQPGAWLPPSTINALVRDPPLFALIGWLIAANGPNAHFLITNSFHEYLGWPLGALRQARRRAIERGWIVKIRRETKGFAALFCWGPTYHKEKGRSVDGG